MLAGVGIISVIIGFAVQDALKDIIKGFDIISDSYYQVGDVIKYGDIEGKVISIGIKTTKVEDVRSFNLISISNRNIEQVEVVSHLINIDVPMPYELKVEDAESVIMDIVSLVKSLNNVEECEYRGVNDLADSSVKYQIKVYCKPLDKMQVRRDSLRCVLLGLEKNNIAVPYEIKPRRDGDLAEYYANAQKAKELLGWEAELTLEDMCRDLWHWQSENPNGY